jgi:YD repeat-containing protein
MDPLGNKTITTYSPPTGIPFDAVTTENALGQKTVTVPTLPFGTPYSVEDPNGNVTGTRYDAAGRLIGVLQPRVADRGVLADAEDFGEVQRLPDVLVTRDMCCTYYVVMGGC